MMVHLPRSPRFSQGSHRDIRNLFRRSILEKTCQAENTVILFCRYLVLAGITSATFCWDDTMVAGMDALFFEHFEELIARAEREAWLAGIARRQSRRGIQKPTGKLSGPGSRGELLDNRQSHPCQPLLRSIRAAPYHERQPTAPLHLQPGLSPGRTSP